MDRETKRKCLNCGEVFVPDACNAKHQRYCSKVVCQAASESSAVAGQTGESRFSPRGRGSGTAASLARQASGL